MASIGDRLREQRVQKKIALDKIAVDTKIGVRLLEAIESNHFEKLPGGVFRRSFVLQYAQALGIDADDIADDLKQLNQFDDVEIMPTVEMMRGAEPATTTGVPFHAEGSGFGKSAVGSLLAAVGVMMGCALFYNWWQKPRTEPVAATTQAPAVPAPPVVKQEAPPAVEAAPVAPQEAAPVVSQESPKPAETAPAAVVTASHTPAAESLAPIRVGVNVGEKTWISISKDGKNIFSNALEAHETKTVEATEKVRLLIGNAGGVEISLNGKSIGPVGTKGQIRVVELTQGGFQIAPPKSSPPTPAL